MKTGRSIEELARELTRQNETKRDYIAASSALRMTEDNQLEIAQHGAMRVNEIAHEQIAGKLAIPKPYYDRMRESSPNLLAENVNHWLQSTPSERRMIRTLDGEARSFLSDRYRPLDHFPLANNALPAIIEAGADLVSCEITDRRLYIKAVTARIELEVKKGDIVQAGLIISNSEVGCGSLRVEPLVLRLVCLNGMIANDARLRKNHSGDRFSEQGEINFFSDDTRNKIDDAFWSQVRDTIAATLTEQGLKLLVERLQLADSVRIEGDPVKVIELTAKKFGMQENERKGVLSHLIEGGSLSMYGLMNAVTRTSQDLDDYDRATELERIGGKIITLSPSDWKQLNA